MLMSITIFAGSIEFVTVNMLLGAFNPLQAFAMTLMINARHLFYGISMLDKFRGVGRKKFYLIFGMCDESFSINYTADIPEDVDRGWFMFFVYTSESFLLVLRCDTGRNLRFPDPFQHGRTGIRYDGYVRGDLYGAVAQRKESYEFASGAGNFPALPHRFRCG